MNKIPNVIVIEPGLLTTEGLIRSLAQQGWLVRACGDKTYLPQLLAEQTPAAVILSDTWDALLSTVAAIHTAAPEILLLVMAPDDATTQMRAAAMNEGADACFTASRQDEMVAFIRAGYRRLQGKVARSSLFSSYVIGGWRLVENGRVLMGPAGQLVPLTGAERDFLLRLMCAPGGRLSRIQLVQMAAEDGRQGEVGIRSIDVTVSRLRSKARSLRVELPLKAVRQWGYLFLDNATN